jgi:hypothetical protein
MTVAYPRKFGAWNARAILHQVVQQREIHLITLNRYRFSEQRSCKDLTNLVEQLDGQPPELIRDLSRHISDEARHALWLTDLLCDLGAPVGKPPGTSYIEQFETLLDSETYSPGSDEFLIASLAAINVTEKRGCEYFSAHIYALKQAPQTEENVAIRETIERIFPEEAAHVRWGNRWLAHLARKSPRHEQLVNQAKQRYSAIEQAAFESRYGHYPGGGTAAGGTGGGDCPHPARVGTPRLSDGTAPVSPTGARLQRSRIDIMQRAWQKDPQKFIERFIPLFLNPNPPAPEQVKR